jgi:hypothetical protein
LTRGLAVGLLCLAATAASAAPFTVRTVPHPFPAAGDFFGTSVALAGGRLVVGAPRRDQGAAVDAGAVYVFDAATGTLLHALAAPSPVADARLGTAVAAAGDVLVAGAPHEDSGAPHAGAIHVFALGSGAYARAVANPEPALDDGFGGAVAAAGGDVVVGARLDGAGIADGGAAYVVSGSAPRLTLLAPTPAAYALVGTSVATDGALVVVGAPGDATLAPNGGAAHVFAFDSGVWLGTLRPAPPALGDDFGRAVAVGAGMIVVGAPLDEAESVSDAGAVYVFDAATLAFRLRLTSPEPAAGGRFGTAVALRGSDVVVGAPHEGSGAVHLFAADGTPLGSIANPTPAADDQFGAALATEGMVVAVGAWHDDAGANDAGAVHLIVDLGAPSTTTTTVGDPPPTSSTATSTSTTATSATSSTLTTTTAASTSTTSTPVVTSTTTPASLPTVTTTSTLASATTTTTLPPAETCEPGATDACDDGDGCTLDACTVDGQCLHAPLGGLDGVTCRLDAMRATMAGTPRAALGGPRVARRLARWLAQTEAHVVAARVRGGRARAGRLARAGRALGRYMAGVARAQARGRIGLAVSGTLLDLAREAAARLADGGAS